MGSQVPVWIPIIVALLGLVGVILTQALAGYREARRALDDAAREERRWQRERQARTHEARAAAYAQLMGAIEAFDGVLFQARLVREAGIELDPIDAAELRDARSKAQQSLGPTVLHAPEEVRRLIRDATLPRMRLSTMLLDSGSGHDQDQARVGRRAAGLPRPAGPHASRSGVRRRGDR
ncbi:MAG: hypothetical protein M3460_19245 [Actinomycetota bacterium]|nr:hypothetical protein [Actinomycetota bacterium]